MGNPFFLSFKFGWITIWNLFQVKTLKATRLIFVESFIIGYLGTVFWPLKSQGRNRKKNLQIHNLSPKVSNLEIINLLII